MSAAVVKCSRPGCGMPVRWCLTDKNRKPIPVDPDPNAGGNLVVTFTAADGTMVVAVSHVDADDGRPRYMPHHATCKNPPGRNRTR